MRTLSFLGKLNLGSFDDALTTPSPKRLDFGDAADSLNQTPSPKDDSVTAAPSNPAPISENPTPSTIQAGLGRGCNYITQQYETYNL